MWEIVKKYNTRNSVLIVTWTLRLFDRGKLTYEVNRSEEIWVTSSGNYIGTLEIQMKMTYIISCIMMKQREETHNY